MVVRVLMYRIRSYFNVVVNFEVSFCLSGGDWVVYCLFGDLGCFWLIGLLFWCLLWWYVYE